MPIEERAQRNKIVLMNFSFSNLLFMDTPGLCLVSLFENTEIVKILLLYLNSIV
jgi:hypothetical protein